MVVPNPAEAPAQYIFRCADFARALRRLFVLELASTGREFCVLRRSRFPPFFFSLIFFVLPPSARKILEILAQIVTPSAHIVMAVQRSQKIPISGFHREGFADGIVHLDLRESLWLVQGGPFCTTRSLSHVLADSFFKVC